MTEEKLFASPLIARKFGARFVRNTRWPPGFMV
jgi:hypothetical protein